MWYEFMIILAVFRAIFTDIYISVINDIMKTLFSFYGISAKIREPEIEKN